MTFHSCPFNWINLYRWFFYYFSSSRLFSLLLGIFYQLILSHFVSSLHQVSESNSQEQREKERPRIDRACITQFYFGRRFRIFIHLLSLWDACVLFSPPVIRLKSITLFTVHCCVLFTVVHFHTLTHTYIRLLHLLSLFFLCASLTLLCERQIHIHT